MLVPVPRIWGCVRRANERVKQILAGRVRIGLSVLTALVGAAFLVTCTPSGAGLGGPRPPTVTAGSVSAPALQINLRRAPILPLEPRDNVTISAVVSNAGAGAVNDVSLEMTIAGPDGQTVMAGRQSHLSLPPRSSQEIYWEWRVPDRAAFGPYRVAIRGLDASGRVISGVAPANTTLQIVAPSGLVRPSPAGVGATGTSPYLCGANIDPQILANLPLAKQMGLTSVRLPAGPDFSRSLQLLKDAGIQPLIILHGWATSDPTQRLVADQQMVDEAQKIFGRDTRLFYEIGNENDLQFGLTPTQYAGMWNALVPPLKEMAPNSWFGGPVESFGHAAYIADFVNRANPKPDFISWHEYPCRSDTAPSACLQFAPDWATQIADVKQAIRSNGDAVPPIMITEWNYAPDDKVPTDNKHGDPAFMTRFTDTALQSVIDNDVYAAYQFNVYVTPLLGSPQGQAFENVCRPIASGAGALPLASATLVPLATVTAAQPTPSRPAIPTDNAPGPVLARDTFLRPDQTLWGTAADGQVWTGGANTDRAFSIRNHVGQISGGIGPYDAILGPDLTDGEVLFTGSMTSFQDSNIGAVLRWSNTDNWYKAYLDGSSLVVQKKVNGSYILLGTIPFLTNTNTSYTLRFRAEGTALTARAWPTSQPEPSGWLVTATDTSFRSGKSGLRAQIQTGTSADYTSFAAYALPSGTSAQP